MLALAVQQSNFNLVKKLLEEGANPNQGLALVYAIEQFEKKAFQAEEILMVLLKNGADPLFEFDDEDCISGYDNAFAHALGNDCSFTCFKLLYDHIPEKCKLTISDLRFAASTFDSNIVIFLIEQEIFKQNEASILAERLNSYTDNPDSIISKEFLKTDFYKSVCLLYEHAKAHSLPINDPTIYMLLQVAIEHQDFPFAHSLIKTIDYKTLQSFKINDTNFDNILFCLLDKQHDANFRILSSHQAALVIYFLLNHDSTNTTNSTLISIKKQLDFFFDNIIQTCLDRKFHSEINEPFLTYLKLTVQTARTEEKELMSALSNEELSIFFSDKTTIRYYSQAKQFAQKIIYKNMPASLTQLYNKYVFQLTLMNPNIIYNFQKQNIIIDKIAKIDFSLISNDQSPKLMIKEIFSEQSANYPVDQMKQAILNDVAFYINQVGYCAHTKRDDLAFLTIYNLATFLHHTHSPDLLINLIYSEKNIYQLGESEKKFVLTKVREFFLKYPAIVAISQNQTKNPSEIFASEQKTTSIIDKLTENQKIIFLKAITRRKTYNFFKKYATHTTSLKELSYKNYLRLIYQLRFMPALPNDLHQHWMTLKSNSNQNPKSPPEILTPKEKIIYNNLLACPWKISHRVSNANHLEKIENEIYSVNARKFRGVPSYPNNIPSILPHLNGMVFATIGPLHAPTPLFLLHQPGYEIDVNGLLNAHPNFFNNAQISFHLLSFFENQQFNPGIYYDTACTIFHKDLYRHTKFMLGSPWNCSYQENLSISQGFYTGKRLLHILSLLFILKLRYIGGKLYDNVINHPDNLELIANIYGELIHPGILELQCLFALPIDPSYTTLIPPASNLLFSNVLNPKQYASELYKQIALNQPDVIDELLKINSIEMQFCLKNVLFLANNTLLEKILINQFPIPNLDNCFKLITSTFEIMKKITDRNLNNLLNILLKFTPSTLLTNLLIYGFESWEDPRKNLSQIIQTIRIFIQHGVVINYDLYKKAVFTGIYEIYSEFNKIRPDFFLTENDFYSGLEKGLKNRLDIFLAVLQNSKKPTPHFMPVTLYSFLLYLALSNKIFMLKMLLHKMMPENNDLNWRPDTWLILYITKLINNNIHSEDLLIDILKNVNTLFLKNDAGLIMEFNKYFKVFFENYSFKNQLPWHEFFLKYNLFFLYRQYLPNKLFYPLSYKFKKELNANPSTYEWNQAAKFFIDIMKDLPVDIICAEELYAINILLTKFPEIIPQLTSQFSCDNFHDLLDVNFYEFYPEENYTLEQRQLFEISYLSLFFENNNNVKSIKDQLEILNDIEISYFTANNLLVDHPEMIFLIFTKWLFILLISPKNLKEHLVIAEDFIINHHEKFNNIEKYFDMPSFTIMKLKMIFHDLLPEKFSQPSSPSAADIIWFKNYKKNIASTALDTDQQFWADFYCKSSNTNDPNINIGVGLITCLFDNKKHVFLGRKRHHNQSPLIAPGGFLNGVENSFVGTLREIQEETGFTINYPTNIADLHYLQRFGRVDLAFYTNNNIAHPYTARHLFFYEHSDTFNHNMSNKLYNINFYWLDFNTDITHYLSSFDDFDQGRWVPIDEIIFNPQQEKFSYNNEEIATSNALLILKIKNIPIPDVAINEAIYQERHTKHLQSRSRFNFFNHKNNANDTLVDHSLSSAKRQRTS